MPTATLTSKGQVTIPKSVREFLKVKPGDLIDFHIDDEGRVVVCSGNADVAELKGFLHCPGRPAVSVEEMEAAVLRQGKIRR